MPLPTDQTLSLLPYSRPGDAIQSKPKTAMLVRMSAETLAALESQPAQAQIHFEFGDKPGIYVGDTYFPMKHSKEDSEASPHELYLRAASANKKAAPLKLFANVVGKFQVERELTKELRDKISGSTQDAVKQRNSRNIVVLDTPPDIPLNSKKRKDPSAGMFRKPIKPSDTKGPSAFATPIDATKVPAPSAPSSSSKEPGGPLRTRVIRCLAASPKPEEELLKLICGSGASHAQRREVLDLLQLIAELDSTKKPPQYRLKTRTWLEVRPYGWSMNNQERLQMLRNAREALQSLGVKESDPAWDHVRDKSPVSVTPASSSTISPEQSRSSTSNSAINGKIQEVQPKRGLSSRELKEKAKRPKSDPKAEITAKDESLRAPRPAIPAPEPISRIDSNRSNLAPDRRNDPSRMNPPEPRRAEPTRSNEPLRTAESSAVRKPPAPPPEPKSATVKTNGRPQPPPAASTSLKREREDNREATEPPTVSRVTSTAYNEDKSLPSQRIKRLKRESGIDSDDERDRERLGSSVDRAKAKAKREESPRDDRLDRAKMQDRHSKRDDSPRDDRVERLRAQERPVKKREESPRDDKAERLKAKERSIRRAESPGDDKTERIKTKERAMKREESPVGDRVERTKLKEKAIKREESPRSDMRASISKRKIVDQYDDDDEDDYRNVKSASQVKKRKAEAIASSASVRAREREREQDVDDRDRERERERERERRERDRDRKERDREREREKEKDREQRIRERERDERRKDGSPLKQSHVEPRSSKGAPLASSARSKPSKREESPPPIKKKIPATVPAASPDSHSTYSNDHQRSKSSSAKPRRRSPIYTSSSEEDEEEEAPTRRGTKISTSSTASRDTTRKLPTDRSSLRKRYDACYDEYTEIYSRLIKQRHILRKLRDNDVLPDGGSDSDGDSGLMDVDDLEALTKKYHKLCSELKSIQDVLKRPLKSGENLPASEMLKA